MYCKYVLFQMYALNQNKGEIKTKMKFLFVCFLILLKFKACIIRFITH